MTTEDLYGVHTALVTPMLNGEVCYEDLEKLIEHQIAEGINGLVAVGTTGESPTLDYSEHVDVIRFFVEKVNKRVPVFAGTGSNSTDEAQDLTSQAHAAGVDGFLLVAPYYNKPSQEGLYRHFAAIAKETDRPIILYSIPSRCGIEIGVETVARLRQDFPHICSIKEAGGSCDRVSALKAALDDDFVILSGDDGLTLPFMSLGAKGIISVASNLVVKDLVDMVQLALKNDFVAAQKINSKYTHLFKDLFIEPNPVPVKHALVRAGLISSPEVRLPLCEMSKESELILNNTLINLGY